MTKTIMLHPIFNRACVYIDHPAGELDALGDALGRDCIICSFVNNGNGYWLASYSNNGNANEDWAGWGADVLAPLTGVVEEVYINPSTNMPGTQNPGRASSLIIKTAEGVHVLLGHIKNPVVKEGDTVTQGQHIAQVGNDGYARNPHIHIGAWQNNEPLAIEFDRQLMADMKKKVGEGFWLFGTDEVGVKVIDTMIHSLAALHADWVETRGITRAFLEELSDADLNKKLPREKLNTILLQAEELTIFQADIVASFTTRVVDFGDEYIYEGLSKDVILEKMAQLDIQLEKSLQALDGTEHIEYYGETRNVHQILSMLISHENMHIGQIIAFCYAVGIKIPPCITDPMALEG
ncbi:MAG: peptidoglycan DD-metalloendopeptidase family protein [Defluviitaleaceae bacterium]|nr:peptidoglycan DD-metalloendopeptidase family protein [Defluviitaleaceae bacterium]